MGKIKEETYVYVDLSNNSNKYWKFEIHSDGSFHVFNGRQGEMVVQPVKMFGDIGLAEKEAAKKVREKLKKGYTKADLIDNSTSNAKSLSKDILKKQAFSDILGSENPIISAMLESLVSANIHQIIDNSDITYDEDHGLFKTPIGIISLKSISEARIILDDIIQNYHTKNVELVNSYLRLVPQKIKSRVYSISDVFPDEKSLLAQYDLLDNLTYAVSDFERIKKSTSESGELIKKPDKKLFETKISIVEDKDIIDKINKFYNATRQSMHLSYRLKLKRVYEIEIDKMNKDFIVTSTKIGNICQLWHGTRISNILSIFKHGLIIPSSNASHVTGRLFGNGLYFSDQSTKSLNYSDGYWKGTQSKRCFMFLADVAMGKAYSPKGSGFASLPAGYDSTFAKANHSGVYNNEMIVYKTNQANLRYLVEFEE